MENGAGVLDSMADGNGGCSDDPWGSSDFCRLTDWDGVLEGLSIGTANGMRREDLTCIISSTNCSFLDYYITVLCLMETVRGSGEECSGIFPPSHFRYTPNQATVMGGVAAEAAPLGPTMACPASGQMYRESAID